jgi:hypothetical protein
VICPAANDPKAATIANIIKNESEIAPILPIEEFIFFLLFGL